MALAKKKMAIERFSIRLFFPDGALPEVGERMLVDLAGKWMGFCSSLLESEGPVLNQDLGGTLAHFRIRMGGPIGVLEVHKKKCFLFAASRGLNDTQDQAAVLHFKNTVTQIFSRAKIPVADDVLSMISSAASEPSMLAFDYCDPAIDEEEKGAIFELGQHLIGAYFRYCEGGANQISTDNSGELTLPSVSD